MNIKMSLIILAIITTMALIVFGVREAYMSQVIEGKVIHKMQEKERYFTKTEMYQNAFDIWVTEDIDMYDDPDFIIEVLGITRKGTESTSYWHVTEHMWNQLKIGDPVIDEIKITDYHEEL